MPCMWTKERKPCYEETDRKCRGSLNTKSSIFEQTAMCFVVAKLGHSLICCRVVAVFEVPKCLPFCPTKGTKKPNGLANATTTYPLPTYVHTWLICAQGNLPPIYVWHSRFFNFSPLASLSLCESRRREEETWKR